MTGDGRADPPWCDFVVDSPTPPTRAGYPPLALRLGVAVVVVVWGALKDRRGAIAVGMVIAMPLWSSGILVLLTALPRLRSDEAMDGGRAD